MPRRVKSGDDMNDKTIEILSELSAQYFKDNPNSTEFQLQKALFGSKLGVGINKQGRICKALSEEYPFITESKGFITIERKGLEELSSILAEKKEAKETLRQQYQEHEALRQEISDLHYKIHSNEEILNPERETRDELKAKIQDFEKEHGNLTKENEELESKLKNIREKKEINDKQKAEFSEAMNQIGIDEENSFYFGKWLRDWFLMTRLSFPDFLNIVKTEKEPMKKLYAIYKENQSKEPNYKLRAILFFGSIILFILALWYFGFFSWIYNSMSLIVESLIKTNTTSKPI